MWGRNKKKKKRICKKDMMATKPGTCYKCEEAINIGDFIHWIQPFPYKPGIACHSQCPTGQPPPKPFKIEVVPEVGHRKGGGLILPKKDKQPAITDLSLYSHIVLCYIDYVVKGVIHAIRGGQRMCGQIWEQQALQGRQTTNHSSSYHNELSMRVL